MPDSHRPKTDRRTAHFERRACAISIVVYLSAFLSSASFARADEATANEKLRDFQSTHSTEALNAVAPALLDAYGRLQKANAESGQAIPLARRQGITTIWARLFDALHEAIDPKFDIFDITDQPSIELVPPREKDGTILPSGVDPQYVKDPIARRAYEKALLANDKKRIYYNYQSRLSLARDGATQIFAIYVRSAYGSGEADQGELRRILGSARAVEFMPSPLPR